jgi:hypothetical protein
VASKGLGYAVEGWSMKAKKSTTDGFGEKSKSKKSDKPGSFDSLSTAGKSD